MIPEERHRALGLIRQQKHSQLRYAAIALGQERVPQVLHNQPRQCWR